VIGTAFQATDQVIAGRQHHPAVFGHRSASPGRAEKHIRVAAPDTPMGLGKDLLNGIVSVAISVGITVYLAEDGEEYDLTDVALAVAISAFLSGLFSSRFSGK
jgi:hypothetical protein